MTNAYERETVEFQPVVVTRDGVQITNNITFAIVKDGERPTTFSAGTWVGGQLGVMIQALQPGTYRVYAKITATPEIPVVDCGFFYIV